MTDPAVLITGIISVTTLLISLVMKLMPKRGSGVGRFTCPIRDDPELREMAKDLVSFSREQLNLAKDSLEAMREFRGDIRVFGIEVAHLTEEIKRITNA
jgi:hypothetical protein